MIAILSGIYYTILYMYSGGTDDGRASKASTAGANRRGNAV